MNVNAAFARSAQVLNRKDAAISYHDGDVCLVRSEKILSLVCPDFLWLLDPEAMFKRKLFDWRRVHFLAAAGRLVRLRPDSDDVVTILQQALQRWQRRLRRAHENDAHDSGGSAAIRAVGLGLTVAT
jgi:hypothetical protein